MADEGWGRLASMSGLELLGIQFYRMAAVESESQLSRAMLLLLSHYSLPSVLDFSHSSHPRSSTIINTIGIAFLFVTYHSCLTLHSSYESYENALHLILPTILSYVSLIFLVSFIQCAVFSYVLVPSKQWGLLL